MHSREQPSVEHGARPLQSSLIASAEADLLQNAHFVSSLSATRYRIPACDGKTFSTDGRNVKSALNGSFNGLLTRKRTIFFSAEN